MRSLACEYVLSKPLQAITHGYVDLDVEQRRAVSRVHLDRTQSDRIGTMGRARGKDAILFFRIVSCRLALRSGGPVEPVEHGDGTPLFQPQESI